MVPVCYWQDNIEKPVQLQAYLVFFRGCGKRGDTARSK